MTTLMMIRRPSLIETFDTIFGLIYGYGDNFMDLDVNEIKMGPRH